MTRPTPLYLRLVPPLPAGRWRWTLGRQDGQAWCGWRWWPEDDAAPPRGAMEA